MSKVALVYGNHWNFGIVVADTLSMIRNALLELGIDCFLSKELVLGSHNILLENFTDEYVEQLLKFNKRGGTYSIIASELLINNSFNDLGIGLSGAKLYGNTAYWDDRFNNFLKVAPLAEQLFHLNPQHAFSYSELLSMDVTFFPHGYTSNFKTVNHRTDDGKDIDILFTGSMTPHRQKCIDSLATKFNVHVADVLTASFYRDDLISRSKLCLNIKQSTSWQVFSNSRGNFHLNNNSLLISENCDQACHVLNYIQVFDDIVEAAADIIDQGLWRGNSQSFAQYKDEQKLSSIAKDLLLSLA